MSQGYKPALAAKTSFFRRGQIGSYKDEMEPDVLDVFLDHARPTLEKFGYIDSQA